MGATVFPLCKTADLEDETALNMLIRARSEERCRITLTHRRGYGTEEADP